MLFDIVPHFKEALECAKFAFEARDHAASTAEATALRLRICAAVKFALAEHKLNCLVWNDGKSLDFVAVFGAPHRAHVESEVRALHATLSERVALRYSAARARETHPSALHHALHDTIAAFALDSARGWQRAMRDVRVRSLQAAAAAEHTSAPLEAVRGEFLMPHHATHETLRFHAEECTFVVIEPVRAAASESVKSAHCIVMPSGKDAQLLHTTPRDKLHGEQADAAFWRSYWAATHDWRVESAASRTLAAVQLGTMPQPLTYPLHCLVRTIRTVKGSDANRNDIAVRFLRDLLNFVQKCKYCKADYKVFTVTGNSYASAETSTQMIRGKKQLSRHTLMRNAEFVDTSVFRAASVVPPRSPQRTSCESQPQRIEVNWQSGTLQPTAATSDAAARKVGKRKRKRPRQVAEH